MKHLAIPAMVISLGITARLHSSPRPTPQNPFYLQQSAEQQRYFERSGGDASSVQKIALTSIGPTEDGPRIGPHTGAKQKDTMEAKQQKSTGAESSSNPKVDPHIVVDIGSKKIPVKPGSIDDVSAVGQRDVGGRGMGNWYSIESEIKLGKQYAMNIERSTRFITDPVVSEYVNRVGQNIVKNSDCKVPFTIKVIDSDEINAMALPGGFFYARSQEEIASILESREQYTVTTSEFDDMKARLARIQNMRRLAGSDQKSKPTLRRASAGDESSGSETSRREDRPTLQRREDSEN